MSESQSRYSIVERLTQRKLDIISSKSDLKEDLRHKEQKVEELKKDLENWDKDVEEDNRRERRNKEKEIDKSVQKYQNLKERMAEKGQIYDQKINAIGEALKSIEEISKTSPTINS